MFRLGNREENVDEEEERLRAELEAHNARQEQKRQQLAAEPLRRAQELAQAQYDVRAEKEAEELARQETIVQRKMQARQEAASLVQYRVAPDPESPSVSKLPPAAPLKPSSTRRSQPNRTRAASDGRVSMQPARRRPVTPDIVIPELEPDGFVPLANQQPSMLEAMKVSAGVTMGEKVRSKAGGETSGPSKIVTKVGAESSGPSKIMTRKEYLNTTANPSTSTTSGFSGTTAAGSGSSASPAHKDGSCFSDLADNDEQSVMDDMAPSYLGGGMRGPGRPIPQWARGPRDRGATGSLRPVQPPLRSIQPPRHQPFGRGILSNCGMESAMQTPGSSNAGSRIGKRLGASESAGCLGDGGTITANRNLLRDLFMNAAH